MIYGQDQLLDAVKISDLADRFMKYTTSTKIVSQGKTGTSTANSDFGSDAVLALAKDCADIVLAEEGNLVQNLLNE